MKTGRVISSEAEIKEILISAKTIAVVGVSPKPDRDSNMVALYLKENGYRMIPIRPARKEILGEKAKASLTDLSEPVDIVDVFRRSDQIMEHAREAADLKPKVFWMQLGIENQEAALFLNAQGIDVVMNRCIKVDHERLIKPTQL